MCHLRIYFEKLDTWEKGILSGQYTLIYGVNVKLCSHFTHVLSNATQEMKFSVKYFFNKCEQFGLANIYKGNSKWKLSLLCRVYASIYSKKRNIMIR